MSTPGAIKRRTLAFAVAVARRCRTLNSRMEGRVLSGQLLRSATSVGANYRATCRARSLREFVAKLGVVIEECDESLFWIEVLLQLDSERAEVWEPMAREAHELLSIFVVARGTARQRLSARKPRQS
ncbi:MAG: four helix bundle protein [Gemmatimonadales bacterium]